MMSVYMDPTYGDYQDHMRSQEKTIQTVTANLANVKQEYEVTQVNQITGCIKTDVFDLKVKPDLDFENAIKVETKIPFLADLIKLEQKSEILYYGEISSDDLDTKINQVDSLDRNIAGSKEFIHAGSCTEKGDQCSCTQCCSHVDNLQKDEKSLYRTSQHEVFSERLSEHMINNLMTEVNKNGDVSCLTAGDREEYTQLTLTEEEVSMNVTDCQKMSLDMSCNLTDPYITELQMNINYFQAHSNFYLSVLEIYRKDGKQASDNYKNDNFKNLPKKPKLNSVVPAKSITKLTGLELLKELKNYLVLESTDIVVSFNEKETNIEEIKKHLINCEKHISQKKSDILKVVVIYGKWLEKLQRINYGRFKTIIMDSLHISISWARKLRRVSDLFEQYTKLQHLQLTVTTAASLITRIELAIKEHPDEAIFWK